MRRRLIVEPGPSYMSVILTNDEEREVWMRAPWYEGNGCRGVNVVKIVARGAEDQAAPA